MQSNTGRRDQRVDTNIPGDAGAYYWLGHLLDMLPYPWGLLLKSLLFGALAALFVYYGLIGLRREGSGQT